VKPDETDTTITTDITDIMSTEGTEESAIETTSEAIVPKESHYTFKTHVSSTVMDEIMGQDMHDAYYNLIDAVLAGETSFRCKDKDTYDWVMGQYPYLLFPVIDEYIDIPGKAPSFADGVGYFTYTIPYEEFKEKLQEFENIVVGILNKALEDEYSDFEKALALYQYFISHYTYDYDTYNSDVYVDNISGYRLLTWGKGICQEISVAYSYLLLQAGVDATVMKGAREYDGENHQWSFVNINGKHYHIDPTYGLGKTDSLAYFMMTDEERYYKDSYNPQDFIPSTVYSQIYGHPEYKATDDSYSELWNCYILSWNADNNTITCESYDGKKFVFEYGNS